MLIKDNDWTLFDHDPVTGRMVWLRDNGDGTTTARTDYPADALIDENTAFRNSLDAGWKGDYHRIASIPLNIFHEQLAEASKQDDNKFLSKWLNDSDNAAWRTKAGKV